MYTQILMAATTRGNMPLDQAIAQGFIPLRIFAVSSR